MKKTSKKSRESISVKRSWSAGGIVVNPRGQVLVVSQRGKSWSLPKGHREKGETREQAARREIAEETGVSKLEKLCLLGTYERYRIGRKGRDDKRRRKVITLFLFCTRQRVLRPQDRNNPEARWVSPNRVTELLTHQRDKDVFVRWWKKAHCYRIG